MKQTKADFKNTVEHTHVHTHTHTHRETSFKATNLYLYGKGRRKVILVTHVAGGMKTDTRFNQKELFHIYQSKHKEETKENKTMTRSQGYRYDERPHTQVTNQVWKI